MTPHTHELDLESIGIGDLRAVFATSFTLSHNGSILYIFDNEDRTIYQYNLGTPFDLSTTPSTPSDSFELTTIIGTDREVRGDIIISQNGQYLYFADAIDTIYQFQMTIPHDVSTIVDMLPNRISITFNEPITTSADESTLSDSFAIPSGFTPTIPTVTKAIPSDNTKIILTLNDTFTSSIRNANVSYTHDSSRAITDLSDNVLEDFEIKIANPLISALVPQITTTPALLPQNLTPESEIEFTVSFGESVTGFTQDDIIISGTANSGNPLVSNFASTSATHYTFDVERGSSDGTVMINIPAGAANAQSDGAITSSLPQLFVMTFDNTRPSVEMTSSTELPSNDTITSLTRISFTLQFSELVSDLAPSDIAISGTAGITSIVANTLSPSTGPADAYTFDVQRGTSDGTVTISIPADVAQDAAGNDNTESVGVFSFTIDTTPPTVQITSSVGANGSNATSSPVTFTATFSELVLGLESQEIKISGTASNNFPQVTNFRPISPDTNGFTTIYTFDVPSATNGTVTVQVPANAAQDVVGHDNIASNNFTILYNVSMPSTTDPGDVPPTPRESNSNSGGGSHSTPPRIVSSSQLGGGSAVMINDRAIDLVDGLSAHLSSPVTSMVGEPITLVFNLYDPDGIRQTKHVSVYFDIPKEYPNDYWVSDTYMVYEKFATLPFTVHNTDNNILSATYDIKEIDSETQQFTFTFAFSKPLDGTGIVIRTWDNQNSAASLSISNALKITTEQSPDSDVSEQPNNDDSEQPRDVSSSPSNDNSDDHIRINSPQNNNNANPEYINTIKQWIGYDIKVATDKDVLYSLNILDSEDDSTFTTDVSLPNWTKKYLGSWAIDGIISYDEFIDVISYLYENTSV
jgi:hypothetical protein